MYIHDQLIFEYIINNQSLIDGMIKKQIFSYISPCGIYQDEEVFIKPISQKEKIIYDNDNKLTWINQKIKYNDKKII